MSNKVKQSLVPILLLVIPATLMFLLFLAAVGPLTNADPDLHFYNIYALATGQAFIPASDWTDAVGNEQRTQIIDADQRLAALDDQMNNKFVSDLITLPYQYDEKLEAQREALTQTEYRGMAKRPIRSQYFPLIYAPQALAFGAGTAAGFTPWTSLKLARVCVFLLSLAIECAAIWILPRGKTIFALVGIMPAVVFLQSSIGTDGLMISCVMLLVALFAHGYVKRSYSPVVLTVSVALIVILFLNKYIYALLALPFVFVPEDILPRKTKVIAVVASLLVSLGLFGGWKVVTGASYTCTVLDLAANKAWVFGHIPKALVSIALSFVLAPTLYVTISDIVRIPFLIVVVVAAIMGLGPLVKDARTFGFKEWLSKWRFVTSGFVGMCLAFLALLVVLTLTWHDFGSHPWPCYLEGVQDRYFIPFLPLLVLMLYPVATAPAKTAGEVVDKAADEESPALEG